MTKAPRNREDRAVLRLRRRMDALNRRILTDILRRADLAAEIAALKVKNGSAVRDPVREAAMIRAIRASAKGPLSKDAVGRIFRTLIRECRRAAELRTKSGRGSRR